MAKTIQEYMQEKGIPAGMQEEIEIFWLEHPPAPWEGTKPDIPKPDPGTGNTDKEGVLMLNLTKPGGKEYYTKEYKYKRSKHNQSNEKNIPRDTYWLEKVPFYYGEYTFIGKIDFEKEDDFSFKVGSFAHSDKNALAGQCYSVGISSKGEVHLSKETPKHPKTPNFDSKAKIARGMPNSLGSISNKTFGCKLVIYAVDNDKNMYIECWVDMDPLDENKKPRNNWKLFFTATDDGSWKNKPQTSIAKGNNTQTVYHRIDHVGDKTQVDFASAREIVVPTPSAS